jgi:hypothetical protein
MKLKDLLKESMVWERNFGEPLPTLDSVMEKYQQEGGKGSGRKPEKGSAKDIEKKSMKAATDANAKMDAAEKEMKRKAKEQAFKDMENESVEINEKVSDYNREYLNKRTGFDVWNDKKLPIIVKNMKLTMNDLEKTVRIKDGKSFDDVLQRISVSVNILKKYLNLR